MNKWIKKLMTGCLAVSLAVSMTVFPQASEVSAEGLINAIGQLKDLAQTGEENEASSEEATVADTYNLLLVGSDRRNDSWNGNSDTMILVTLNPNTETLYMVSFMRDLAANIPGVGTRKLNAAYATGGAALLEETLESNFGVQIDNYAAVDFVGVVDIIDALGGVEITQTAAEAKVTNDYIRSLCSSWGLDAYSYYVSEGTSHLNGLQALAYMRDRYVGNDYARTERQRTVLTKLFENVDLSDVSTAVELLQTIADDVETDLDLADMLKLAGYMKDLKEYTLETDRIPYDDLHGYSGEMLVPSQPETNNRLLAKIYAVE